MLISVKKNLRVLRGLCGEKWIPACAGMTKESVQIRANPWLKFSAANKISENLCNLWLP
jgi:hypothetical protein